MNRRSAVFVSASIVIMLFIGCGSSEETTGNQDNQPSTSGPQSGGEIAKKADTLNVDVQNTQRPVYDQKPGPQGQTPSTSGKFSVQIGAYKLSENAERIAALARERFGRNVYTIPDRANDLYKVMVGDFTMKDDARKFRDEMVQKYPSDYKDAWVTELQK